MRETAEVWYQEGSAVTNLAESFRNQFCVRVLTAQSLLKLLDENVHQGSLRENGRIPVVILTDFRRRENAAFNNFGYSHNVRIIGFLPQEGPAGTQHTDIIPMGNCFALFQTGVSRDTIVPAIEAAVANIGLALEVRDAQDAAEYEREELNRIGIALSSTRDVRLLLEMILAKTREITCADAGSLYTVETSGSTDGLSGHPERRLRFKLTQNDTKQFPYTEYTLPISEDSMAGYTALHGEAIVLDDVYNIPPNRPYRFNASYDVDTGYRTRSLLTVPMKNARGEVIGVMQLLNRKRNAKARLIKSADIERELDPSQKRLFVWPNRWHLRPPLLTRTVSSIRTSKICLRDL